jgi:RNA-binding protein YhbY
MKEKAWILSADMGYGHQRAAYPFKDIAHQKIITINSAKANTLKEKKQWKNFKFFYEGISRIKSIPIIGSTLWAIYDNFQKISPIYPFRDLSKPTFGTKYLNTLIKKGFLSSIINYIQKENIPTISTFFAPAIAGSKLNLKNNYCIATDTDINRIWVSLIPKESNIIYLTPTENSTTRLLEYGIKKENVIFTGFPLPKENTGNNLEILKNDLKSRLHNLDPKNEFKNTHHDALKQLSNIKSKKHTLTITFAIGGAGAQKEIAIQMIKSLKKEIKTKKIKINIVVGIRFKIKQYIDEEIEKLNLSNYRNKGITILFELNKKDYFTTFNNLLHKTDILWTKPSELSFYTALGIPIIIAPPIGYHEKLNKRWLIEMGAGIEQYDPNYTNEWLFKLLEKGTFAEAAWRGYNKAPKYGTYNIEKIIFTKNKNKIELKY